MWRDFYQFGNYKRLFMEDTKIENLLQDINIGQHYAIKWLKSVATL